MRSFNKLIQSTFCAALLALPALGSQLNAHCQVPCGIFDDAARVKIMLEDAETVGKAVRMLNELAMRNDAQSLNQMVRWISNKETHAQNIITTISDYFMAQRVKTSFEDYNERLVKHHAVMIAAMKAKQSASQEQVEALIVAIKALATYYPDNHKH